MATEEKDTAAHVTVEIEQKFDVPDDFDIPDFGDAKGVAAAVAGRTHELHAIYFDTADLRLQAHKVTLRFRRGGDDAGWHLKKPAAGGGRTEIQIPCDSESSDAVDAHSEPPAASDIPQELLNHVLALTRGEELTAVATLDTTRHTTFLQNSDDVVLAEVADDHVRVTRHYTSDQPTTSWHEVEVELLDGDNKTLKAAAKLLRKHGATASSSGSKLSRALADYPLPRHCRARPDYSLPTAGDVILAYLTSQIDTVMDLDPAVRVNEFDAIHQLRVSSRKLRSALASFRGLFDRELTDPLRDELKWLASAWSQARDLEVVHMALIDLIDNHVTTNPNTSIGFTAIRSHADNVLTERFDQAFTEGISAISSPRYFALLDALEQLVEAPPLSPLANKPADKALLAMIGKDWRKLQKLHDRAVTIEGVHDLRKGAKRSRYAADALKTHYGKPAKQWAKLSKAITENLGDHQDAVVMRATIRQLADDAHRQGHDTFAYGYLYSLVEVTEEYAEAQHPQQWSELTAASSWFNK